MGVAEEFFWGILIADVRELAVRSPEGRLFTNAEGVAFMFPGGAVVMLPAVLFSNTATLVEFGLNKFDEAAFSSETSTRCPSRPKSSLAVGASAACLTRLLSMRQLTFLCADTSSPRPGLTEMQEDDYLRELFANV
jgi:hypothetical protein